MDKKHQLAAQKHTADDFARSVEQKSPGMIREFWGLLRHNKKWWLAPIIIVTVILSALMFLFGTPAAPLIYTLF